MKIILVYLIVGLIIVVGDLIYDYERFKKSPIIYSLSIPIAVVVYPWLIIKLCKK